MMMRCFSIVLIALLSLTISPVLAEGKTIKILSIDGGGVKGIVSARILQEIEKRTKKHTTQLFSAAIGTSTGGLLVLGLALPNADGSPKNSAKDMVSVYKNYSKKIFKKTFLKNILSGYGLWGAKYDRENLDAILKAIFQDAKISETLIPVYAPIYLINENNIQAINTISAKENKKNDFYLRDVAGATTSAPTYFAPKKLDNILDNVHYLAADGGLYVNDPEITSILIDIDISPKLDVENMLIISIGTAQVDSKSKEIVSNNGILGWLKGKNLISNMIDAETNLESKISKALFKNHRYRMEVILNGDLSEMDNANDENLKRLLELAEEYISNNDAIINEICYKLTR
jgi:patatin-like phospholipase/acyl hydrolase